MLKGKQSERGSGRPRGPSPDSNDDDRQQPPPGASNSTAHESINTVEDCLAFLREVEENFKDDGPGKYTAFLNLILDRKHGRVGLPCMISQVKELFGGHTEMLKQFNAQILPADHRILFKEDVPEIQDLANLYMAKVKARSSPSEYTTFLYLLYLWNERALPIDEIDREVEMLFAKSCDLLQEYDCFRPDGPAPVEQSPVHPRHSALQVSELQRVQLSQRLRRMCEKVAKRKRKEKGKGVVPELKKQQWPAPPPVRTRMSARLANLAKALRNRRSSRPSIQAHARTPNRGAIGSATPALETPAAGRSRSRSRGFDSEEHAGRAMCTPSYLMRKPPMNGDGHGERDDEVSVHRSELAKSVLNEECELVRERDSKERPKHPDTEVLFDCERNQHECDLISKKLEATAQSFMKYLLKLQNPNIGELPPVKELLTIMNESIIELLYGGHTQVFIEELEENPTRALPVLINRLVSKLEETKSHKIKMTPIWSQVYKNHFHFSLDYSTIDPPT